MKKILKLLSLILLLSLLIPTIGFADSPNTDDNNKHRPKLIIGDDKDYPPYSYLDSNGDPTGFDIELAKAVGEAIGYDVEIRLGEWSDIREALDNGEIDVLAGMFYSLERAKIYSFTSKNSLANGDIFTQKSTSLKALENLRGKTVVVEKGEIVGEYLANLDLDIKLVEVPTVVDALKLIDNGTYEYAGLLKLPGLFNIRENGLKNVYAQGLRLAPLDNCMAVKNDREDLLMALDEGLKIVKDNGQFEKIYDKWLGIYEENSIMITLKEYSWILLLIAITVLLLIAIAIILKNIVNIKTRELQEANAVLNKKQDELTLANKSMEVVIVEITVIEEELREQYNNLIDSELKLKTSLERNKAIVNALPDIVFILDGDGKFIDCQASNVEDLLLPPEMFYGKYLNEVLPADIAQIGYDKIRKAMETNVLQSFEYELIINGNRELFELRIVKCSENEVIGITRNISARRLYQDQIEYLSYHDQLTGLYNRRYFEFELSRLDNKFDLPLCIVMADVNGLKLINDSFGHTMGDQLLIRIAEVFKKTCNKEEIVSRIGGDEFVILIPQMEKDQAEELISQIKSICDQQKVGSVGLSISFGWDVKYKEEEDIHEVFNRAEGYMYKKKLFESPSMRGKTIGAIINTLYEKNQREEQHSQRVSDLCKRLAQALHLSERDIEEMKMVGLLHDIGKIAINEEVLNKEGSLTAVEFDEIKRHPEIGYRILSAVNDMSEMADYILFHHERWDGKGYPRGLKGEEIPIQARMIAVADTFDAITSDRSYRLAKTEEEAVRELIANAGTQFDPDLIEPFVRDVIGYTA